MKKILIFIAIIIAAGFFACENKDGPDNPPVVGKGTTTISFNANGGSGTMEGQLIPENTSAVLTANAFIRNGYTFAGWSASPTGTKEYDDRAIYKAGAGTHSVTLYAVWTEITVSSSTVTFNANGGTGGQTASVTAVSGQPMPPIAAQPPVYEINSHPDDPYENNYEKKYFNGYYDAQNGGKKYYDADLSSAANWDKTADAVLYAQWLTPAEKLGVTLGSGTGGAAYGFIDDFVAYYADTPPVIDGNGGDPCWAKAKWMDINYAWMYQSANITLPTGASTPTPAGGRIEKTVDFSGRFKAVWTEDRLYILAEITDDQIKTPNTGNVYQNPENNDCLEIFISESASASTQARGTAANSTAHFFAYHMNFTTMVDAMDYVGGSNNTSTNDPNIRIENGFIKRNHHLNYKIGKNDETHTYIWETEMKVYGNDYPVITSPEDRTPVTLTNGKKMGFAVAYNDNDTTTRNHFIGSMYVQGSSDDARNQGYKNASVYAKLHLVK
jgi:uncharacterized repeat protein (TIGR02543 family)